ncbi:ThiJ/PfpI family protein [plant metagenome]|uniref:ThiJ/PfpI family protein n=1 Tax=plant metagenome TaxID=1297885 RepID=A0A484YSZ9_9ZZZZ
MSNPLPRPCFPASWLTRIACGLALCAIAFAAPAGASTGFATQESQAMPRILFVLTSHDRKGPADAADAAPSGFYLSEVTHPHKVLSAAGYAIDFVSPKGGKTHVDGFDLDDPVNAAFWNDPALRAATENTLAPAQVDPDAYAAIFYAGGHATMWDFPDSTELAVIAARIYERGGVVAAVCHGPAGLVNLKLSDGRYLVAGKDVSAFTNDEERAVGLVDAVPFLLADVLQERGARHVPAPNFQAQVVVSERLVTGQNPASAQGVAEAMLPLLPNSQPQADVRP